MAIVGPDESVFEELQKRENDPRVYNVYLAKLLDCLIQNQAATIIEWNGGVPYALDPSRSKQLSLNRPTLSSAYYGRAISNRYLRMDGVTTMSQQGFLCPRDATITGLWAKSRSSAPWSIEIRKNGLPITLVSTSIVGSFGSDMALDVDVDAGDWLQFFASGTNIEHPLAAMEFAWRLDN